MTTLPYWPYSASDNVGNAVNSFPNHIISNASIQQISFQSRYNAVEPQEVQIRLYENIANGSGLDISMMGDMRGYEDERNYEVFKKVYSFHKQVNIGKIYYMYGYQEHKNILLDAISYVLPESSVTFQTNAPARVETILKEFVKNTVSNKDKQVSEGMILHLVNLTGFSGNTYFGPLPVYNQKFPIKSDKKPSRVFALTSDKHVKFNWKNGIINLEVEKLEGFEGVVIEW